MRFGLSALSNPISRWVRETLPAFRQAVATAGHSLDERAIELAVINGRVNPRERAELTNTLFTDDSVDAILDVSGGDLANETLDFLDYDVIRANRKPFAGFSDLSVVLLALYERASIQPIWWHADRILNRGADELAALGEGAGFTPTDVALEDQATEAGTVIKQALAAPILGGNLRCIAKLAGTSYWPTLPAGSTCFLEARSLDAHVVATYLTQLRHAGFFDDAGAVLLGQFTKLDEDDKRTTVVDLLRENLALVGAPNLPILHAPHVGHSADAEPLTLG